MCFFATNNLKVHCTSKPTDCIKLTLIVRSYPLFGNIIYLQIMIEQIKIKDYLLYLILAFNSFCFSQSKQFQHITSAEGISQSEIYSFLEDSQGYLWFGTVDGLNKYDGYKITTFNTDKNSANSITNNTIRCLAEDQMGRIWIGTDDGLSLYDSELEKIYQINLTGFNDKLLTINSILIKENKLYLGTSMGLLFLNIDTNSLEQIAKDAHPVELSNDSKVFNVVATELGHDGNIWFTTSNNLFRVSQEGENPIPIGVLELQNQLSGIRNLKEDSHGNLWLVSHNNGFLRFNTKTKEIKHFKKNPLNKTLVSDRTSDVAVDKDGNLWIGTRDKGLLFLEEEYLDDENPSFEIIQNAPLDNRSLNSNLIYSLYISKNNLLWIGTIASGINMYDPYRKPFYHYNIQSATNQTLYSTNFVRAVYADPLNNIWMGTHNNGLYILNREKDQKSMKTGFDSESIFHISEANKGNLIVCTGQGVSLVKKVNNTLKILSTLPIGATFFATKGKGNIIWVAALDGIKKCKIINQKLEIEQEYSTNSKPQISFNNSRVIVFNKETNELFVGTEGGGLNIVHLNENDNADTTKIYKKSDAANSLSNNYIRSIIMDSNSDIWIGTYEGLNKMYVDPVSGQVLFKTYTKEDGLPNNTIQSIVEDNQKKLWIGTNQGLSKFDPTTETFTHYTSNDGVQSNEFSEHTVFKKRDGEIIIGGIDGINTFYPQKIKSSEFKPNTTITDFYLFNKQVVVAEEEETPLKKSVSLTDSIFLQPNQTSLGFEFSAMIYNAPEKIKYAYLLEGFDTEWNYSDAKNRRANYTNLSYGDYAFKVKATNNDGVWEDQPKSVFISIETPFYYTTLAFVIYGLLALFTLIFFTNYTAIRSTTKKKILLENQLNKKVRELEEFRSRFFINISHDLRTPLTLISSPLEIVLKNKSLKPEVQNYLNIVQRNVKKLKDMTEELLDVRKIETIKQSPNKRNLDIVSFLKSEVSLFEHSIKEKGLDLQITSDEESMMLSFDSDMISKVIFNVVSNALKHTEEGEVIVDISKVSNKSVAKLKNAKHENYVRIQIKDSGKGIDSSDLDMIFDRFFQGKEQSSKGYGIGLSHSKDLVEAHDGVIDVESKKGLGTTFKVFIPNIQTKASNTDEKPLVLMDQDVDNNAIVQLTNVEYDNISIIKSGKVLLIEDNVDLRNFIGTELSKTYQVLEAADGENGLEMANTHFPDLIISDVMMPKMDGIEFCKQLKSNIKTSHIPVILLTAKVNKESKYEGIEIGADDYISKPFEMDYLFLRIKNLLQNRARLRNLFKVNASLEPASVTVTSIDEKFLATLLSEIEKGIPDSEFTINALEQELGMSHSSFYNKIKSLTGQSAKELVFNMRMKRAKQILEDTTNIRISEVAFMVGFSDPKYFSKCFKEYYKKSPSDFVKK